MLQCTIEVEILGFLSHTIICFKSPKMSSSQEPFFSIVLPTYNRTDLLTRALSSIFKQTFKKFELIVIDDGSKLSTPSQLKKIQAQFYDPQIPIFWYFLPENQGVSFARNYGIQKARSSWICLLDSDDEWVEDKLECYHKIITSESPPNLLFHSNEVWIKDKKVKNQKKKHTRPHGPAFLKSLSLCLISPSSVCLHKDLFTQYGPFREDFEVCEDYDFWLRVLWKNPVFLIPQALTIKHGGHSHQLSQKYHSMDFWRIRCLYALLWNPLLSFEDQQEVLKIFQEKCHILIQGYKKYGHTQNLKLVKDMESKTTKSMAE